MMPWLHVPLPIQKGEPRRLSFEPWGAGMWGMMVVLGDIRDNMVPLSML